MRNWPWGEHCWYEQVIKVLTVGVCIYRVRVYWFVK